MKKFVFVALFTFGFATLSAVGIIGPEKMTYNEAVNYCKNLGMHLATEQELKEWGGSSAYFWSLEGNLVRPDGSRGVVARGSKPPKEALFRCLSVY